MSKSSRAPRRGWIPKAFGLSLLGLCFIRSAVCADREVIAAYDQAMSAYKAGVYEQALKDLDQLDTLDLDPSIRAESLNLRAVILMREADYEGAEKRLRSALELAPLLANAKFNLGQISFLKRDWTQARQRFEQMLTDDHAAVENDVRQLIGFKIFLTLLLDRKEGEAAKLMDQWQQTSPAAYYAHVAMAKDHALGMEANKLQQAAKTKFGEATDKLYAESFYELGWDERPARQLPERFEISTAAERERRLELGARDVFAKTEADTTYAASLKGGQLSPIGSANDMSEKEGALEMLGLALSIDQKQLPETEVPFRTAFTDLSSLSETSGSNHSKPFLNSQQASQAREELEKLFAATNNPRSRQFILYKVFLTFLLESSDYQAELLMQRFSYTDETPVLYYAQGAWAFQHGDSASGNDWIEVAARIYSAELNALFLDDFYRLHWLDQNLDQDSSTRISVRRSLSNTLLVQSPPLTLTISPVAGSNSGSVSQFFPGTGASEVPWH